jgi:hypothetical protein
MIVPAMLEMSESISTCKYMRQRLIICIVGALKSVGDVSDSLSINMVSLLRLMVGRGSVGMRIANSDDERKSRSVVVHSSDWS